MTLAAAGLALAIGAGMGLLGGGGSLVAVPAFTFLLHLAPKDAIATSLAIVGFAAAAGAASGFVRRIVPVRLALTVGLAAMAGAYAGGMIGARLSDHTQLSILAAVMFVAAVALWRQPEAGAAGSPRASHLVLAILGVAIGLLTGLVGVGGGFIVVPVLVIGAGLPMHQAAAASLFVITLAAFSGLAGYLVHATLDWGFILPLAAIAVAGTLAGGVLAVRLPQRRLQQGFAIALVVLGAFVFVQL